MPSRAGQGRRARRRLSRREAEAWRTAFRQGAARADEILGRQRKAALLAAGRLTAQVQGVLVAEGDSWFDYPFCDVLECLEDEHGYSIESVAHKGDTVEEMAYDDPQIDKLTRKLRKLAEDQRVPKAILLSGGGNDVAGETFSMLLNHRRSGLPPLNDGVVSGVIDERLRGAVVALAAAVTRLSEQLFGQGIPILVHGYDHPVPDGRGYLGGFWVLPGPWLEPGFRRKGYDDLAERCALMKALIDRFNDVLADVAGRPGLEHMIYVDLRGSLSTKLAGDAYQDWWDNELHPTKKGFEKVALRFHQVLSAL